MKGNNLIFNGKKFKFTVLKDGKEKETTIIDGEYMTDGTYEISEDMEAIIVMNIKESEYDNSEIKIKINLIPDTKEPSPTKNAAKLTNAGAGLVPVVDKSKIKLISEFDNEYFISKLRSKNYLE